MRCKTLYMKKCFINFERQNDQHCFYFAGTAVLFTYLWQLLIFGGFVALSGRAEEKQKHAITLQRVKPSSQSSELTFLTNVNPAFIFFPCSHFDTPIHIIKI